MRLFSYVVARDFGFAPNPFYGTCTLATCKPRIRSVAQKGDWIVGISPKPKNKIEEQRLVYIMRVSETLSFEDYWDDPRFQKKKPLFSGSLKQAYGDNIYAKAPSGKWQQAHSHHSFRDGTPNQANVDNDTQTNRILVGTDFAYWGAEGPVVPESLRSFQGFDLRVGRNHKSKFPQAFVDEFTKWFRSLDETGCIGRPGDW